jgi:type 1 glutamine amidotransferase
MLSKFIFRKLFLLLVVVFTVAFNSNNGPVKTEGENKVLIFSKTNGFRHESIPAGIAAIKQLGEQNNFSVVATEDSTFLTDEHLRDVKVLIFLSTTGTILGTDQEKALQNFIHRGGGFVGVHAASDCEYQWPWYVKMIGGNFESHPKPQVAKLLVVNKKHPSTKFLPPVWERKDEWYNFKNFNPSVTVLIKIDESSYEGGKNGKNHPMAWYHNYEGGRVFYTELGHTVESYSEPLFLKHLLGGIKYAMHEK